MPSEKQKAAFRLAANKYRAKYPDRIKAIRMAWYARNPGRKSAYAAAYRLGITVEEVLKLRKTKRCAICKTQDKLHIDHCHSSGKVRGMLCRQCNYGLGGFRDKIKLLKAAINYLETT